jgi:hypothetical protein
VGDGVVVDEDVMSRTTITDHKFVRQRYGIWGLSPENEG